MSTKSAAEPSAGGKGIFIALIPWIIFTVLAAHSTLKLGSFVALAAAVVIAIPGIRSGQPKSLEVGAVITFIAADAAAPASSTRAGAAHGPHDSIWRGAVSMPP